MAVEIVDMIHEDGVENAPGLGTLHGFALKSYYKEGGIKKPAKLSDVGATGATVGSIATAHEFAVGKCMKRLYGTENKGSIDEDEVGEIDSTNSKGTVVIVCPGSKAEYIAQKKLLRSSHGFLFITEADGQVRQCGTEQFPCTFKVKWGTGTNETFRGYTITASYYGDSVIYVPGLNFTPAVAP